jgi:hypothetical protein
VSNAKRDTEYRDEAKMESDGVRYKKCERRSSNYYTIIIEFYTY